MFWMYAYVHVPFNALIKTLTFNFSSWLVALSFRFTFPPFFMLHTCSGYLGCGLHYGRNGSPQNPFSGKGLYPWAAGSCVWLLLWNRTWHTGFCPLLRRFLGQARFTSCCLSDASSCSHPPAFICGCINSHNSLSETAQLLLQTRAWISLYFSLSPKMRDFIIAAVQELYVSHQVSFACYSFVSHTSPGTTWFIFFFACSVCWWCVFCCSLRRFLFAFSSPAC